MQTVLVWVAAALAFGSGDFSRGSVPTEIASALSPEALEHFNLPIHFKELITDRRLIDAYQQAHYRVEGSHAPVPETSMTARNRNPRYVQAIVPEYLPDVLKYRDTLPDKFIPLRGYRAPILGRIDASPEAVFPPTGLTGPQIAAAELIVRRLAHDGLLLTLAQVINILNADTFLDDPIEGMATLQRIGFPTDLLACFAMKDATSTETGIATWIATRLRSGTTPEAMKTELAAATFRFIPASAGFRVASESGESELGLLRMQANGGFRDGIVPGGTIDVICQAVAALPNVNSIISLPREQLEAVQWMARNWRLRHTNQVTLIAEPLAGVAWPQDNGKAGSVSASDGTSKLATLTPRYASVGEGSSSFVKGESFSMDGLRVAGHEVAHSRLLFQGGNLLAMRDPKSGERILLIGEGEIHRNIALGLTAEQILEAFRLEFGAERGVILPAASYHLDFDMTVRRHGESLVAFVNDTTAAAREIVKAGIGALERCGALSPDSVAEALTNLAGERDEALVHQLAKAVRKARGDRNVLPGSLANSFAVGKSDSAPGNLQAFLLAIDLLESNLPESESAKADAPRFEYLQALRRMQKRSESQIERLRSFGCTVVLVPSMTDLFRSINYVNGLHYKGGYMMPVFGGFYSALDRAVAARFQSVLGPEARIHEIRSADCQRSHGGVHCAVAAYPKL